MSKATKRERTEKIEQYLREMYEPRAIAAMCNVHVSSVYEVMWGKRLHKVYLTQDEKEMIRAKRMTTNALGT